MEVRIQREDFDLGLEAARLRGKRLDVGAQVSFVGLVRDVNDDDTVSAMSLEHYPGMTEKALAKVLDEASRRWGILDALVIHRVGELRLADQIVLVSVIGRHRGEAFQACEFIMDYLKTRAPFWKREVTSSGERWVDAREGDTQAANRWLQA